MPPSSSPPVHQPQQRYAANEIVHRRDLDRPRDLNVFSFRMFPAYYRHLYVSRQHWQARRTVLPFYSPPIPARLRLFSYPSLRGLSNGGFSEIMKIRPFSGLPGEAGHQLDDAEIEYSI